MKMDLSERIIKAAIQVHKELGPGFLESVYENALVVELRNSGLEVGQQCDVLIYYREHKIGLHRLDLIVEKSFIVELKTVEALSAIYFATVRSYMKATGIEDALILNFASVTLTIKRVGIHKEPTNLQL